MRTCGDISFRGWITATTVQNILLFVLGATVNVLSLWCLWKCRRTGRAIKLQLGLVFILLLLICTIILPGEGWINYLSFYCMDDQVNDSATVFFLLSSGFTLQLERMNISSVAIYRFIAVKFPQLYKHLTQVKIVLILEVVLCAYIAVPYVMGFTQTIEVVRFDNGNQYVKFGDKNTTIYKVIYKIYGYNFVIPFLITLVAYTCMVITVSKVLYQKYKSDTLRTRDHVTFTLQFLILVDLLLDGPHAISHFIRAKRVTMTVCHMIFHLHLVADPIIFLFLNPHNRRLLWELIRGALPKRMAAYLPAPTASTSMLGMSSPPPQNRKKYEINRQGSNKSQLSSTSNSQRLQHVFTSSPEGNDSKAAGERVKPLLSIKNNQEGEMHQPTENDGLTNVPLTPVDNGQKGF